MWIGLFAARWETYFLDDPPDFVSGFLQLPKTIIWWRWSSLTLWDMKTRIHVRFASSFWTLDFMQLHMNFVNQNQCSRFYPIQSSWMMQEPAGPELDIHQPSSTKAGLTLLGFCLSGNWNGCSGKSSETILWKRWEGTTLKGESSSRRREKIDSFKSTVALPWLASFQERDLVSKRRPSFNCNWNKC